MMFVQRQDQPGEMHIKIPAGIHWKPIAPPQGREISGQHFRSKHSGRRQEQRHDWNPAFQCRLRLNLHEVILPFAASRQDLPPLGIDRGQKHIRLGDPGPVLLHEIRSWRDGVDVHEEIARPAMLDEAVMNPAHHLRSMAVKIIAAIGEKHAEIGHRQRA